MIKPGSQPVSALIKLIATVLVGAWLAACAPVPPPPATLTASSLLATSPPTLTPDPIPGTLSAPTPALMLAKASPTSIMPVRICSPFPGAAQADLVASISNPFNPPPLGSDDPHQGVDLAVQQNGIALAGGPALAVLSGSVAMVTQDRFPYGYALLIETPLETLPLEWLEEIQPPTPAPTHAPPPALTCPAVTPLPPRKDHQRSLYLLYAHLQEKPAFQPGDTVECGETIGRIGQSGNALNPHLHLEVRVGPTGARFPSMAHYDNTARPDEMGTYCLWRVSNVFQLIDPLRLLVQLP